MKNLFKCLQHVMRICPFQASMVLIYIIILGLSEPIYAHYFQKLIDISTSIFRSGIIPFGKVLFYILVIILYYFLNGASDLIYNFFRTPLSNKLHMKYDPELADKWARLKYAYFEQKEYMDLFSRIGNDPSDKVVRSFYAVGDMLADVIMLLGLLLVAWKIWPMMFLAFIFGITVSYLCLKLTIQKIETTRSMTNRRRYENEIFSLFSDRLASKEMHLFSSGLYLIQKWRDTRAANLKDHFSILFGKNVRNEIIINIINVVYRVTVYVVLVVYIAYHKITIGEFVMFANVLMTIFIVFTKRIPRNFSNIKQYDYFWDDYNVFVKLESNMVVYGNPLFEASEYKIQFKNVSFSYPSSDLVVLKNINIEFTTKESIAIVGCNGAGKSTLAKLLLGLYEPTKGTITINNQLLSDLNADDRTKLFSAVFQDSMKYEMSIRDSISIGKDIEDQRIIEILKKITSSDWMEKLPDGMNTKIGKYYEQGIDLSGGQWQSIALARALLSNSMMIILDEPTAQLDPIAEAELYKNYLKIGEQKGLFIITHRLGPTRYADRIFVIEKNTINESGTHEELMQKGKLYREMYETQSSWYLHR